MFRRWRMGSPRERRSRRGTKCGIARKYSGVSSLFSITYTPSYGGGRGIRTPGTLPGTAVFKTAAIDHSAIPPRAMSVDPIVQTAFVDLTTAATRFFCGQVGGSRRNQPSGMVGNSGGPEAWCRLYAAGLTGHARFHLPLRNLLTNSNPCFWAVSRGSSTRKVLLWRTKFVGGAIRARRPERGRRPTGRSARGHPCTAAAPME
jgi:hypothetical protein